MIISIEELERSADNKITLNINELISDLQNDVPVVGELEISSLGMAIEVKGHVETDLQLECGRCLKKFLHHVELDIDEKYVKGTIVDKNIKEFEIKNNDFLEELGDKQEIDITDLVYQCIVVNIPVKQLCDAFCEGNPELKKYLKEKEEDPRMQVFKDLKDKFK